MADITNIKRRRNIDVDEERVFPTIADTMNACFGKTWSGFQRGFYPLNDGSGHVVWFPKMAFRRGNVWIPQGNTGWLNTLSNDGLTINLIPLVF